jgi:hypothetical protein
LRGLQARLRPSNPRDRAFQFIGRELPLESDEKFASENLARSSASSKCKDSFTRRASGGSAKRSCGEREAVPSGSAKPLGVLEARELSEREGSSRGEFVILQAALRVERIGESAA